MLIFRKKLNCYVIEDDKVEDRAFYFLCILIVLYSMFKTSCYEFRMVFLQWLGYAA